MIAHSFHLISHHFCSLSYKLMTENIFLVEIVRKEDNLINYYSIFLQELAIALR